jgi:hypothetical protein
MKDAYQCTKCGAITKDSSHLCSAQPVSQKSQYCGTKSADVCDTKKFSYECGSCGRVAEQPDLLCKPSKHSV